MIADQQLLIENNCSTRWLLINRPASMNALTPELAELLIAALDAAQRDNNVDVIVLSGVGKAFCSGADLKAFKQYQQQMPCDRHLDFLDKMQLLNQCLRKVTKPTIAAVNGLACAGGLELIMCCDLTVAVASAMIGDAHANVAAFPGGGGASVLARRIGMHRARYVVLTGQLLPAATWEQWGVINQLVNNADTLRQTVQQLADNLAAKSPLILRELKRVMDDTENRFREQSLVDEMQTLRALCQSHDLSEGLCAFLDKRNAHYKGR